MSVMNRCFIFIFAVFLQLFSASAFADFPALNYQYRYSHSYHGAYIYGSTPAEACSRANSREDWSHFNFVGTLLSATVCRISTNKPENSPYIDANIQRISAAAYCPANATLVNGMCSCNAGYEEDGASCVPIPPPDPCEGLSDYCAQRQQQSFDWQKQGKFSGEWTCKAAEKRNFCIGSDCGVPALTPEFPGCNRGCMGSSGGFSTTYKDDEGNEYTSGQGKYTGATCDPSVVDDLNGESDPEPSGETTKEPDQSCQNGFKGTVNGVSVCVPPKSSSGVTEMETKDNGDGTKTDTKTEVKCEGGKCEVTKTSTTTNTTNNSTVSSSSVTTTVDKKAYCQANKTAGVCKDENGDSEGNGKFGGSCGAGFTCEGDAVQCAIAKEQHKRMCEIFDDKAPEKGIYDAEKGKEGIQRGEGEQGSGVFDLAGRISTDTLIGSGSCLSDITFQFMGKPVTLGISELCPFFEMLGYILVAVGMIMAVRIVGLN